MKYESRIPLKTRMVNIGESPCERWLCKWKDQCAAGPLACRAFGQWVETGRAKFPEEKPTRDTYDFIFHEDDLPIGGRVGWRRVQVSA